MAVTDLAQTLADAMAHEVIARQTRFQKAWAAYHGNPVRPLKVRPGQPDDNVLLAFPRVVVDKGVSALFGQDLQFELAGEGDGDGDADDSPAQQWLALVWKLNKQPILLQKLAMNGGITGHTFLKIQPREHLPPRLIVLDPVTVTPTWDPEDLETVLRFKVQYNTWDVATHQPVVRRQLIEQDGDQWLITDQVSPAGSGYTPPGGIPRDGPWTTLREVPWPWPWAPIVHCQNLPCPNEFWGISDLEYDTLHLSDVLNRVLSNLNKITRLHAHPKTWSSGMGEGQARMIDFSIDALIGLPSPQAQLHNLEMLSDLSGPLALYHAIKDALHEVARIPAVALGKLDNVGPISGVALQVLYGPLVEKTETKRRTYGTMLDELNDHLLELGGFGPVHDVQTHWPELIPSDPLAERQVALIDRQLGVSTSTLQVKLGYDPDLEAEKGGAPNSAAAVADALIARFDRGQDGDAGSSTADTPDALDASSALN